MAFRLCHGSLDNSKNSLRGVERRATHKTNFRTQHKVNPEVIRRSHFTKSDSRIILLWRDSSFIFDLKNHFRYHTLLNASTRVFRAIKRAVTQSKGHVRDFPPSYPLPARMLWKLSECCEMLWNSGNVVKSPFGTRSGLQKWAVFAGSRFHNIQRTLRRKPVQTFP